MVSSCRVGRLVVSLVVAFGAQFGAADISDQDVAHFNLKEQFFGPLLGGIAIGKETSLFYFANELASDDTSKVRLQVAQLNDKGWRNHYDFKIGALPGISLGGDTITGDATGTSALTGGTVFTVSDSLANIFTATPYMAVTVENGHLIQGYGLTEKLAAGSVSATFVGIGETLVDLDITDNKLVGIDASCAVYFYTITSAAVDNKHVTNVSVKKFDNPLTIFQTSGVTCTNIAIPRGGSNGVIAVSGVSSSNSQSVLLIYGGAFDDTVGFTQSGTAYITIEGTDLSSVKTVIGDIDGLIGRAVNPAHAQSVKWNPAFSAIYRFTGNTNNFELVGVAEKATSTKPFRDNVLFGTKECNTNFGLDGPANRIKLFATSDNNFMNSDFVVRLLTADESESVDVNFVRGTGSTINVKVSGVSSLNGATFPGSAQVVTDDVDVGSGDYPGDLDLIVDRHIVEFSANKGAFTGILAVVGSSPFTKVCLINQANTAVYIGKDTEVWKLTENSSTTAATALLAGVIATVSAFLLL